MKIEAVQPLKLNADSINSCVRQHIIERAEKGEIEHAVAEKEADERGLPPLATLPHSNLDIFTGYKESEIDEGTPLDIVPIAPRWTLVMTLEWIIRRDPDTVSNAWNAHRASGREWKSVGTEWVVDPITYSSGLLDAPTFREQTRWRLARFHDATMADAINAPLREPTPGIDQLDGRAAQIALWEKLSAGELTATSTFPGELTPVEIPRERWDMSFVERLDWPADAIGRAGRKSPDYYDVTVDHRKVLKLWPPNSATEVISDEVQQKNRINMRGEYLEELNSTVVISYSVDIEAYAIEVLAPYFDKSKPETEQIARDEAHCLFVISHIDLTDSAFDRVWRGARKEAGLPPAGASGRKRLKKSPGE